MASTYPAGLRPGGRKLWREITTAHELNIMQRVQLEEACRAKDRLDQLDLVLRGDANTWMTLAEDMSGDGNVYELRITNALGKSNDTANLLKQLLAALRLPDDQTGKVPQRRGPRGAQKPTMPGGAAAGGKVSSLERARAKRSS